MTTFKNYLPSVHLLTFYALFLTFTYIDKSTFKTKLYYFKEQNLHKLVPRHPMFHLIGKFLIGYQIPICDVVRMSSTVFPQLACFGLTR